MLINKSDYRLGYWEDLSKRDEKVKAILTKLKGNGSSNHYASLSRGNGPYKVPFINTMNNHCSYCGASYGISLKIQEFEIDHIDSSIRNNDITNLAPSCEPCNRSKLALGNDTSLVKLINPYTNIFNVFERNEDYSICIKSQYIDNPNVVLFYKRLHLDSQTKRLDYFLLLVDHLSKVNNDEFIRSKLNEIFAIIIKKRNSYSGAV